MSYAKQLLDSYPGTLNADAGTLAATLDALHSQTHPAEALCVAWDGDGKPGREVDVGIHGPAKHHQRYGDDHRLRRPVRHRAHDVRPQFDRLCGNEHE